MTTVGQIHPEKRVAWLKKRGHRGEVRRRAGVGLDIGVVGAEELLGAIDRELLDFVDDLAAAIVALARKSLGVLVGQRRSHRFEDRGRNEVLARDQLEATVLPLDLTTDEGRNLWISRLQGFARCGPGPARPVAHRFGHCGQVRTMAPTAPIRCSASRSAATYVGTPSCFAIANTFSTVS